MKTRHEGGQYNPSVDNGTGVAVLRLGWVFHAVGVLFVLLAGLFPLLMWLNNEPVDTTNVAVQVVMAICGAWSFLYTRAYQVRLLDTGSVLSRLWSRQREVQWSGVVAARFDDGDLVFETTDGRVVKVSGYLPEISRLIEVADERLPKFVWRE